MAVLSLLSRDPLLVRILAQPADIERLENFRVAIKGISRIPLLHTLMKTCAIPDLRFEALFVRMRRVALLHLPKLEPSRELLDFLSTLAMHCFTNDYLYPERDDEVTLVAELQETVCSGMSSSEPAGLTDLLCLATYRQIHQLLPASALTELNTVPELRQRIFTEPLIERTLSAEIPSLGEITDVT